MGKFTYFSFTSEKKAALITSLRKETECDLVGAWTVEIGDLDQSLHLWRFKGGYYGVDKARKFLDENSVRNYLS